MASYWRANSQVLRIFLTYSKVKCVSNLLSENSTWDLSSVVERKVLYFDL